MKRLVVLLALIAACGDDDDDPAPVDGAPVDGAALDAGLPDAPPGVDLTQPPRVDLDAPVPKRLSAWNLFAWDREEGFTFNPARVVPYDLNSPLFSDYALKQRAIFVPEGQSAAYDPENGFAFPVGAVIVKNFYFPADFRSPGEDLTLIETRLLVRHEDGWHPLPYIWDAEQSDAVYSPSGQVRAISFVDVDGASRTANYVVPQRNQCESCHGARPPGAPTVEKIVIGLKARHMNRSYDYGAPVGEVNQLEHLAALGLLSGLPPIAEVPAAYDFRPVEAGGVAAIPAADVDRAARDYLDINCAHCHNPVGVQGMTSQLFLNHDNPDLFNLGVCKRPGSAGTGTGGFSFDIVPGDPDTSILYFRTQTEQVGAMMPLLGRSLRHDRGAELLHAWIAAMPPDDCLTR